MVATAPDGAVPLDAPLDIEAYPDEYVWCATAKRPLPCCWIAWPSLFEGTLDRFWLTLARADCCLAG